MNSLLLLCLTLLAGPVQADTLSDSLAQSAPIVEWTPSPTGAALRSLALPGWGQFYNDQPVKAGVIIGLEGLWLTAAIVQFNRAGTNEDEAGRYTLDSPDNLMYRERRLEHLDRGRGYLWGLAGTVFYSMVDAYVNAHLYHFDLRMDAPITLDSRGQPQASLKLSYHW